MDIGVRRHRTHIETNSQTGRTVYIFGCADCNTRNEDYFRERIGYADRPSAVAAARLHRITWRRKDADAASKR